MKNYNDCAVIIFAKFPSPGKVKTRLSIGVGIDVAIEFYKLCADYIFNEISKLKEHGIECYLYYGDDNDGAQVKEWVNKNFIYAPQSKGDLGNKMSNAFQTVFDKNKNKVLIVGTDIPDITKDKLISAFESLEKNNVVISPSHDGGYNFIGMTQYLKELFDNINWSTNEVFQKTVDKINELNLSISVEESLLDIDNKADLDIWLSDNFNGNIKLKDEIRNLLNN